jgi:hypothetical protein
MKYRNPVLVFCLSVITFGLYFFYWYVKTSNEMNKQGANIPIALLIPIIIQSLIIDFFIFNPWICIPNEVIAIFALIYAITFGVWLWRYSKDASLVIGARGPREIFLILFFCGPIGMGIIQNDFNETIT